MSTNGKQKDFFIKITTIQFMLFTAILSICFLSCKFSDSGGAVLKKDFKELTAQDMSFEDFKALLPDFGKTNQDEENADGQEVDATIKNENGTTSVISDNPEKSDVNPVYGSIEQPDTSPVMFLSKQIQNTLVLPVDGRLSSSFGARTSPIYGYNEQHKGIDIAAKSGTTIRAVMNGIVSMVDYTPGRGNFIILDHLDTEDEKIQTLYQHCEKILVKEGTVVRAGETIALVGSTGDSTGPHLHLEYRVNGDCKNPITELFGDSYEI